MDQAELEQFCSRVEPLGNEATGQLTAGVLCRIIKGDKKGRSYSTPRNPGTPSIQDFHPRIGVIPAGELAGKIRGRRHGIFPDQAERVRRLTDAGLLQFRIDDPMSGNAAAGGFSITGGHHRMNEITRRVQAGELPPETPVRILFHD